MYLDKSNQYADSQACTAATTGSTNIIDHGSTQVDVGHGEPMAVVINVEVAAGGTTPTFTFTVQKDTVAAFDSRETVISQTIAAADMTAGATHVIPIPMGALDQRYSGVYPDLGGTSPTCTVSMHLIPVAHIQSWTAYSDD